MPIDIISLSNGKVVPIVIPSDIGLIGEVDAAFLPSSCFGLGVKSVSQFANPREAKHDGNTVDLTPARH